MIKPIELKEQNFRPKIRIIGIGGGGNSIISEIAPKIKRASFVAVDTDLGAPKKVPGKIKRFRFNQKLTQGLEREKIKNLFKGIDFCILVSCLGGGAGSGISPIFAEIARKLRNITLGIFILPFEFEGEEKMEIARSSLEKIRPNLNASIVISNENLFKLIDKKSSFKEALFIVNERVAENLEGLIEMLYSSDFIDIDFADLKVILAGRGKLAFLNSVEVKIQKPIQGIARKVLFNRLSPYRSYKAKGILFNITGGENLSLNEVKQIGSIITNLVNPRAKVVFGVTQNKKYQDKIKITLLATGCEWKDYNIK